MSTEFTISVLGSGSQGNCTYFKAGDTSCLVDAGLSGETICNRLVDIGASISDIQHIFITHEHDDHVQGLRKISKTSHAEFHLNRPTFEQVRHRLSKRAKIGFFDDSFTIGLLSVTPFSVSHDASAPVGYVFRYGNSQFTVATDLGCADSVVKDHIAASNVVILESNHDEKMLMIGRYPRALKQRIAGRLGHLSNRQAGELMRHAFRGSLRYLFLAHLSRENNLPQLAQDSMRRHMDETPDFDSTTMIVTDQHRASDVITL